MHFCITDIELYSKDDYTLFVVDMFKTIHIIKKQYNPIFQFHILEKSHTYSYNNISNSDNVNYNNTNINN